MSKSFPIHHSLIYHPFIRRYIAWVTEKAPFNKLQIQLVKYTYRSPFWEVSSSQVGQEIHACMKLTSLLTCSQELANGPHLESQMNPLLSHMPNSFCNHFSIVLHITSRSPKWSLSFAGFRLNFYTHFSFISRACLCPNRLSLLNLIILTTGCWLRVQSVKLKSFWNILHPTERETFIALRDR
jgi:hypothetical protein